MRHPLLIAIVSVLIGGFGIHYLQERNQDIETRRLVAEAVFDYASDCAHVLKRYSILSKMHANKAVSVKESIKEQIELQKLGDEVHKEGASLELKVNFYFSDAALNKFKELRKAYGEALDFIFKKLKSHQAFNEDDLGIYWGTINARANEVVQELKNSF